MLPIFLVLFTGNLTLVFCTLLSVSVEMGLSSSKDGCGMPARVGSGDHIARKTLRNILAASLRNPICNIVTPILLSSWMA
eukprot:5666440-Ditylum_brightwellii.AAC.1